MVTGTRTNRVRNVVIHEIAHQWFGNAVTESDWDDVWLSEGFATYFTLLFSRARLRTVETSFGDGGPPITRTAAVKPRRATRFGRAGGSFTTRKASEGGEGPAR